MRAATVLGRAVRSSAPVRVDDLREALPTVGAWGVWAPLQLLAIGLVLAWVHRAATSAAHLGVPARRSPAAAVAGWFVPVVSLWWPCQSLRDLLPRDHRLRRRVLVWWMVAVAGAAAVVLAVVLVSTGRGGGTVVAFGGAVALAGVATAAIAFVSATLREHRRLAAVRTTRLAERPEAAPTPEVAPNRAASAALVAGCTALLSGVVPLVLAWLAIPAGVVAIVCGALGLRSGAGRAAAGGGLVLGTVGTLFGGAWVAAALELDLPSTLVDDAADAVEAEVAAAASEAAASQAAALASEVAAVDLLPGDCFNEPDENEYIYVEAVPCDEPHHSEVFTLAEHPAETDTDFPGDERLADYGYSRCLAELSSPDVAPDHDVYGMYPDEQLWEEGDRTITCVLTTADGSQVSGSALETPTVPTPTGDGVLDLTDFPAPLTPVRAATCLGATGIAGTDADVWVVCPELAQVWRHDARDGGVLARVDVPPAPSRPRAELRTIVEIDGSLWLNDEDGRRVLRLDPGTAAVETALELPVNVHAVMVAGGRLWAAGSPRVGVREHPLYLIDTRGRTVATEIVLPDEVEVVDAAGGELLLLVSGHGVYSAGLRAPSEVRPHPNAEDATAVAATTGVVWTAVGDELRAAPRDGTPPQELLLPGHVETLTGAGPHLWVEVAGDPTVRGGDQLVLFDTPNMTAIAAHGPPGNQQWSLHVGRAGTAVWAADQATGELMRLDA